MPRKTKTTINQGWKDTATVQEIAPEPLPAEPIVLPEASRALELLQQLAELNDRVLAAEAAWKDAQERAKQKKGKWEQLSQELSRLLKASTHGSSTPLLDVADAEADLARMEAAIEAAGAQAGAGQAESSQEAEGGSGSEGPNASEGNVAAPVSNVVPFETMAQQAGEIF